MDLKGNFILIYNFPSNKHLTAWIIYYHGMSNSGWEWTFKIYTKQTDWPAFDLLKHSTILFRDQHKVSEDNEG